LQTCHFPDTASTCGEKPSPQCPVSRTVVRLSGRARLKIECGRLKSAGNQNHLFILKITAHSNSAQNEVPEDVKGHTAPLSVGNTFQPAVGQIQNIHDI
jgi:hypothetical protein